MPRTLRKRSTKESSGGKGDSSTKLGVSCMNCEDPNSSKNFKLIGEFHNAPGTYDNMRIVFFDHFRDLIPQLPKNSAVVTVSIGSGTAAKMMPKVPGPRLCHRRALVSQP